MKRSVFGRIWPNATAVVLFVGFVFPVYWMFATALKPTGDIISENPVWFPTHVTLGHFKKAIHADHFWTLVLNSVTVTVLFPEEGYHTFSVALVEQGDLMHGRDERAE